MKRSRFSEEQIIAMLREQETGMPTVDVCRKHGVSTATFHEYKARYGGLEGEPCPPLVRGQWSSAILKDVAAKKW